ncbi:putative NADPH-dependent methylglyoxal reductase GRE2 [Hypoxylon sp. FL1284]|nr:putative NADPH-dependent methylglyoxal reductase GRE2 [Hypoxylon sp. FL1284]
MAITKLEHRFFLTGANGFIAQHLLWQLLEGGETIRAVVRSQAKVDMLKKTFKKYADSPQLDFAIVPDITAPGAFDAALQSSPPFDIVLHTASPFFFRPLNSSDYLDPAIKGTTEILHGIVRAAPSVKRVVVTSSFAAVWDMSANAVSDPAKVLTADDWNGVTLEQALATHDPMVTYPASKKFAEKAAWDFVRENNVNFELATLTPPVVYGPLFDPSQVARPEDFNESTNMMYSSLMRPGLKSTDPMPPSFIYIYVDVRDLARAHILAATVPEAAGRRWFIVGGELGNQEIANYLREALPEKRDSIPVGDPANTPSKPEGWYSASTPEVGRVLGLTYRPAEETIKELAPQLVEIEKRGAALS